MVPSNTNSDMPNRPTQWANEEEQDPLTRSCPFCLKLPPNTALLDSVNILQRLGTGGRISQIRSLYYPQSGSSVVSDHLSKLERSSQPRQRQWYQLKRKGCVAVHVRRNTYGSQSLPWLPFLKGAIDHAPPIFLRAQVRPSPGRPWCGVRSINFNGEPAASGVIKRHHKVTFPLLTCGKHLL
jgi:hypothetical protein